MSDTPPPINQTPPSAAATSASTKDMMRFEMEKKSAGVALFLCWVLGIFGAHRFYLKQPNAIAMLIITLISLPLCLVGVGFFGLVATWIWMIVDLFSVSRWAREHNTALLAKIQSGQG